MESVNGSANDPAHDPANESLPHAGPGIASFIIAIAALVLAAVGFIGIASVDPDMLLAAVNDTMSDEELTKAILDEAPMLVIGALLIVLASFITFIGAALGIAGLLMPQRRRLYAFIGIVLNGALVMLALVIGLLGFFGRFAV